MERQQLANEMTAAEAAAAELANRELQGERSCGACTACCTILGVADLKKPSYVPCCHLAGNACGIYADRPRSCRIWSCNWLLGRDPGGDERHRPDALGLMFADEYVEGVGNLLVAYEVRSGAAREPKAAYVLNRLGKTRPVAVLSDGGPLNYQVRFVVPDKDANRVPRLAAALRRSRQRALDEIGLANVDPNYARRNAVQQPPRDQ
jgi:hypothetical protein